MIELKELFWYFLDYHSARLNKEQLKELETHIAEWFANHWRDDDNPKSEYRASRESTQTTG